MNTNWIAIDSLPANTDFPAWLGAEREKQKQAFLQQGLPTRANERWKYADLSLLDNQQYTVVCDQHNIRLAAAVSKHKLKDADAIFVVFVDGVFAPQYSDLNKLGSNVTICSLNQALKHHEQLVLEHFSKDINSQELPFAALNTAMFTDGLFLHVEANTEIQQPVHLLCLSSGKDNNMISPNNIMLFDANSQATVVMQYAGITENNYFTNAVTTIAMGENARLELIKLQHESTQAIHMENFFVEQKHYSRVVFTGVATGASFSRDDITVTLSEPGAECCTGGFYHARHDNQYIDNHIEINHIAANTQSEMLYKGIADNKSRTVFNGRLHVQKDAQKINAHQANHNLLLSDRAEVYSKPELEIYADDVKCKHGATTGQIDQDALFYMRARGISQQEATHILLRGFADEVMERITHPAIRQQAKQQVDFL